MKTIRYQILVKGGLIAVAGEPVEIENDHGMAFGVHCNVHKPFDDAHRYVVTHIETGMIAGCSALRRLAIENARERIRAANAAGTLAASVELAMRTRSAFAG
ncbi:hypothetical protein [Burkholderia cenocepacia]|uniref:hypothetical protein n=1 Tax=Burkholderia cenocepacia TaxID=95486 RepID=UPI001BA85FCD|nr:hypothetical protein [Burkholderia cenocepacia]QUN53154.1 hypothetical protein KEH58_09960 [Burkholderia cenocepacia]